MGAGSVAERLLALEAAVAGLARRLDAQGDAAPAPDGQAGDASALAARLNSRLAALLVQAGYGAPEAVAAASDEELLALDGVGPKGLQLIRDRIG